MSTTQGKIDAASQAEATAAPASVALTLYFYALRGDKQSDQFIGFWPTHPRPHFAPRNQTAAPSGR
ncbi:hypothetical protein ACODNH_09370 [Haloarcula sp. NS06]|uniref:hypothetical protein n=1 Tax=unclassified Haloarcula TaxID=2624677 RepID=UPI0027B1CC59|nr:hypothetical protein [Haloarcula sp. H-GB4]MDQ2073652.1 hypothetical protein [Haloarcula sp. H-GB4]